jgi:GNAT superfamily N-acetyltransferase
MEAGLGAEGLAAAMTAAVSLPPFLQRQGGEADLNYLRKHWRGSAAANALSFAPTVEGHHEGDRFPAFHNAMMAAILSWPSTRVTVAHPPEDDGTILGWLVSRPAVPIICRGPKPRAEIGRAPVVYFCFVREELRRVGVARMLLADLLERRDVIYTSKPPRVRLRSGEWGPAAVRIPSAWKYHPRAAFVEAP